MKKLLTICVLLATAFVSQAQEKQKEDCDCPRPKDGKFLNICTLVENQDFNYKKELMAMACADLKNDSPETIKAKVNCMWEKYYAEFNCGGDGFTPHGNVLKYSVHQGFDYFIDNVVRLYGLNLNILDPADGKTLLDFILDQINMYKKFSDYKDKAPDALRRVKGLENTYNYFKNDFGAKHAKDL